MTDPQASAPHADRDHTAPPLVATPESIVPAVVRDGSPEARRTRWLGRRERIELGIRLPEATDRPAGTHLPVAPLGLDALADEVWAWHVRELGEGSTIGKAAKVCEEAGELIGHVIKSTEPRPDAAEHWQAARLEIADVILSALGAARGLGIGSIDEVVREKWAVVRERRFATAARTFEIPDDAVGGAQ